MADIAVLPSPRLEVRDLRVVLAIASAGSTAHAAALLHLSQPAVSRALLAAEEKLETPLFERTPRGLVLNEAGQRLADGAARLLLALGELEGLVRAPCVRPTTLRIVCECYTAYHWLPSTLARLRESLPGLSLTLCIEHTGDPVTALEQGSIDAALLTQATVPRAQLEERKLFADEIVFVVASTHPLARKKAIAPDDLRAHTILTGETPVPEGQWFMRSVFGRERPRLRYERLPLTEAVLDVARAGMGVAVLSEWIVQPHLARGDLVVKRLSTGALRRAWRFAYRREVRDDALRVYTALEATAPRARLIG